LSGSLDSPALAESAVAMSDRTDAKAPGHRRTKRRLPLWPTVIGWIVTVLLGVAALRHHFEISVGKTFFVASKYRLTNDHVVIFDGLPRIAETIVHLPSGPQALWVSHTTAPYPVSFTEWKGQLALVAKLLRERGLLVAGRRK
jgi:hypothetical protein